MSSIKLTADSGGGTFEIKAPSSSGNTRVLTLPDTENLTLGKTGILQVVQTLKQDVYSQSASSSYNAITGLSVSITPSSASNKILILGTIYTSTPTDDYANVIALYKGGSAVAAAHGTPASPRYGAAMKIRSDGAGNAKHLHHEFLDVAGGTSAITYQYYMASETFGYVGRTGDD